MLTVTLTLLPLKVRGERSHISGRKFCLTLSSPKQENQTPDSALFQMFLLTFVLPAKAIIKYLESEKDVGDSGCDAIAEFCLLNNLLSNDAQNTQKAATPVSPLLGLADGFGDDSVLLWVRKSIQLRFITCLWHPVSSGFRGKIIKTEIPWQRFEEYRVSHHSETLFRAQLLISVRPRDWWKGEFQAVASWQNKGCQLPCELQTGHHRLTGKGWQLLWRDQLVLCHLSFEPKIWGRLKIRAAEPKPPARLASPGHRQQLEWVEGTQTVHQLCPVSFQDGDRGQRDERWCRWEQSWGRLDWIPHMDMDIDDERTARQAVWLPSGDTVI